MGAILKIFLAVLILVSFSSSLRASEMDPKWVHWMTYYYFYKNVESVPDFMASFDDSGLLVEKKGHVEGPLIGCLSQIFAQNQNKLTKWLEHDYSPEMKDVIALALVLGNLEKVAPKSYEQRIGKVAQSYNIKGIESVEPSKPSHLNMMWGAFLCSGESVFVRKVISVLDEEKSPTGNKSNDMILRGAAKWYLTSNIAQHVIVERVIQEEHLHAEGTIKTALDEILEKFEDGKKRLRFEAHEGDFSAGLHVVDPKVMEELKKPSYEGLRVKLVEEAKREDNVTLHLIFSGMALSPTLDSDVSYGMKVFSPDGALYFEDKLTASKRRLPNRFNVFTATDIVGIEFENSDLFGVYKIEVAITDNISGKTLNLKKTVKLID